MATMVKTNTIFDGVGNVERMLTSSLIPPQRLLRIYSKAQIRKFARCIEAFGFLAPVLIDGGGVIIAGLSWYFGARHLELPELPVLRVTHLSEEQVLAYRVAEQRLSELAPWNDAELSTTLKELSDLDLNFDIEITGFSTTEIDLRINGLLQGAAPAEPIETVPNAEVMAITRPFDLWNLGQHRLLCSSSLTQDSWSTLMAGKSAALVFTDPPYNVPIDGHVGGKGAIKHREFAMAFGEMKREEFIAFIETSMARLASHSADGSLHYFCIDWRHVQDVLTAGERIYGQLINICVWKKHNGGMGSFYRSQHELVVVFRKGKRAHRNNIELGRHKRNRSNVWEYAGTNSFSGRKTDEGNLLALHPTVKPVQLIADVILDSTTRGAIVANAFLGSGSSLLAAERVGRKLYGIELDPLYVDVAIRRWQQHTGKSAIHEATGKSFEDVAAGREAA